MEEELKKVLGKRPMAFRLAGDTFELLFEDGTRLVVECVVRWEDEIAHQVACLEVKVIGNSEWVTAGE